MKKIILMATGCFLISLAATAQNTPKSGNRNTVNSMRHNDTSRRILNNNQNNGNTINPNNKDLNNTQPGTNYPGNQVITDQNQRNLNQTGQNRDNEVTAPVINIAPVEIPTPVSPPPSPTSNPKNTVPQPVVR